MMITLKDPLKKLEAANASRNSAEEKRIALVYSELSMWRLAVHQSVRTMLRPLTQPNFEQSSITTEVRGRRAMCKND